MLNLPKFNLDEYKQLLISLKSAGYRFALIEDLSDSIQEKTIFLRHDIDFHLSKINYIAQIERDLEVRSTYYIPISLHFNPIYPNNKKVLRNIIDLGHAIGLHYDLSTYPIERKNQYDCLDWEVSVLSNVIGRNVRTICMHQPFKGNQDTFLEHTKYIHPHSIRYNERFKYISDSCQVWRNSDILLCFGESKPREVMLNLHCELWFGEEEMNRFQYLEQILKENGTSDHKEYFDITVKEAWLTHPTNNL